MSSPSTNLPSAADAPNTRMLPQPMTPLPLPSELYPSPHCDPSTITWTPLIVTDEVLPREKILIAWAILLQRISNADFVTFAVDEGAYTLDCKTGRSMITPIEDWEDLEDWKWTGIFWEIEPPTNCIVALLPRGEKGLHGRSTDEVVISPVGNSFVAGLRYFISLGLDTWPAEEFNSGSDDSSKLSEVSEVLPSDPTIKALFDDSFASHYVASDTLKESIESIHPCTPAQEGMLADSHFNPGAAYMYHFRMGIPTDVDPERLKMAWQRVFDARHVLRTGFWQIDDLRHPFGMVVYKKGSLELPWKEVTVTAEEEDRFGHDGDGWKRFATTDVTSENLHLPPWRTKVIWRPNGRRPEMVISIHHALFDGFSLWLLLEDIEDVYRGRTLLQRKSFGGVLDAINERSRETTWNETVIKKSKDYWKSVVPSGHDCAEGTPACAPFPNLLVREAEDDKLDPKTHSVLINCERPYSRLFHRCKDLGINMQALGQTAWARTVSAYIGEQRGTTGLVLSGRSKFPVAQGICFPCVTTLPVVHDFHRNGEKKTNLEAVQDIIKSNKATLEHQHSSLRNIIKWTRGALHFDTVFVFQKVPARQGEFWELFDYKTSINYKVTIELFPVHNDGLLLRATCLDSAISKEHSDLLIHQFQAAMFDILDYPDASADFTQRRIMTNDLLSIRPAPSPELPTPVELLHQFVERNALLNPHKTALEFNSDFTKYRKWTYQELNHASNRLAHQLKSHADIGRNDIVAVIFHKCAEASIALLAILKTGAAFMAVDPAAPRERQQFILKDSGAKLIVTMPDAFDGEVDGIPVVNVNYMSLKSFPSSPIPLPSSSPLDICYGLYTSGSTGTPKLCLIAHENAVQCMAGFSELYKDHWNEDSRFLQFASFHFDVSVMEQFWSWSVGITVVGAPRDMVLTNLSKTIQELKITHLDVTPSLGRLLDPKELPSLRNGVYITGGEALSQEILEKWGEWECLYNAYGPTETTIGCTMNPRMKKDSKANNIGWGMPNVDTAVFFPGTRNPVPRGSLGELCIGGKLVGAGYHNRPELTAEKFFHDSETNSRMYRTGDLVRMLIDDSLEFCGRIDHQVKLRGQRLEVEEITEVLKKNIPALSAVVTTCQKHPRSGHEQLVTFFCCKEHVATQRLITVCKQFLSPYMVPSRFIEIAHVPLSGTNKIDLHQLKKIYDEDVEAILAPKKHPEDTPDGGALIRWTPDQQLLKNIITEFAELPEETIKPSTSLFEIGLDSVSTIGLAKRMRAKGFEAASPALLMKCSTIEVLEHALHQGSAMGALWGAMQKYEMEAEEFGDRHAARITDDLGGDVEIEAIRPVTPLQEGMLTAFASSRGRYYFNSTILSLKNGIDVNAFQTAWSDIVQRNSILRTCFAQTDEGFAQVVLKQWTPVWETLYDEVVSIEERVQNYLNRNISLHRPPIYFLCLHTSEGVKLNISLFHALYDARSSAVLLFQVQQRYMEVMEGKEMGKALMGVGNFHDYLKYIMVEQENTQQYWSTILKDIIPAPQSLRQPSDLPEIVAKTVIPSTGIGAVASKLNCTVQSVVQAAWALSLSSNLGGNFSFGVVVSGRMLPVDGVEMVVGPMFNTLPCPVNFSSSQPLAELVGKFHAFNRDSVPYQHTPLRKIHKWTGKKSLFDTIFVFHTDEFSKTEEQEQLWTDATAQAGLEMTLAVDAKYTESDGLDVMVTGNSAVMDEENLNTILGTFKKVLEIVVTAPEEKSSEEVRKWLPRNIWRRTPAPEPSPSTSSQPQMRLRGATLVAPERKLPKVIETANDVSAKIRKLVATLAECSPEDIASDTSFFELGFDSVDAVRFSSMARAEGLEVSVADIMEHPDVRSLSAFITAGASRETTAGIDLDGFEDHVRRTLSHARNGEIVEIYPATPLQEGMILGWKASEGKQYTNHHIFALPADVDVLRLREAWDHILSTHDILRTSFSLVRGYPGYTFAQVVHDSTSFPIPWAEIAVHEFQKLEDVASIQKRKIEATMDWFSSPPIQVTLLRSRAGKFMMVTLGHVLYDGWSLGLLNYDLWRSYHGSPIPVRPSPRSIIDYLLISPELAEVGDEFWKAEFTGFQPRPVRMMHPNAEARSGVVAARSKMEVGEARRRAKDVGVTLNTVGMVAWAVCLARLVGGRDVAFGVVQAGRHTVEMQSVCFPAFNTLPYRVKVEERLRDVMTTVQKNTSAYLRLQSFPLKRIQKAVGAGATLFDTVYLFQDLEQEGNENEMTNDGENKKPQESEAIFPISIELQPTRTGFTWLVGFQTQYISKQRAEDILADLDEAFVTLLCSSDTSASSLLSTSDYVPERGLSNSSATTLRSKGSLESNFSVEKKTRPTRPPLNTHDTLLEVISQVSEVPPASIGDQSLLELGLDSISAIELSSLLRERGITLRVGDILKAGTVAKMVTFCTSDFEEFMEEKRKTLTEITTPKGSGTSALINLVPNILSTVEIAPSKIEAILPATSAQTLLLSIWQQTSGHIFHPIFPFSTGTKLSFPCLQTAFQQLLLLHPILRTIFIPTWSSSSPIAQVILCSPPLEITYELMTTPSTPTQLYNLASHRLQKPPNPSSHMVALHVIDTPSETYLFIKLHHALYDAISLPILLRDFMALYTTGSPISRPPSLRAYSAYISSISQKSDPEFWKHHLSGFHYTPNLHNRTTPISATFSTTPPSILRHRAASAPASLNTIDRFCRKNGISQQALYLAAYAKAQKEVARNSASNHNKAGVLLGLYHSNRHLQVLEGCEGIAFPTVNIVPLPIRDPNGRTLLEVARGVTEFLNELGQDEGRRTLSGLWQVQEWTGGKVDCWVNVLRLPKGSGLRGERDLLSLVPVIPDEEELLQQIGQSPAKELPVAIVKGVEVAMDAEISILEDGKMTLGLVYKSDLLVDNQPQDLGNRFFENVRAAVNCEEKALGQEGRMGRSMKERGGRGGFEKMPSMGTAAAGRREMDVDMDDAGIDRRRSTWREPGVMGWFKAVFC